MHYEPLLVFESLPHPLCMEKVSLRAEKIFLLLFMKSKTLFVISFDA